MSMPLFDQILSAVAQSNQLGNLIGTVEQLGNNTGADSSTMQTLFSVVGNQVRSALQDKQASEGEESVQHLVNDYAGTSPDLQAVNALFSPAMQQQIAQIAAQYTGLDARMIQQLLPSIVPIVLNFLKPGQNSLLSSFLDTDNDGDVDMADLIQLASRYLGR
jgi:hypothetical protein